MNTCAFWPAVPNDLARVYFVQLIDILTAYAKIGTRQKMELLQEKQVFLPQLVSRSSSRYRNNPFSPCLNNLFIKFADFA